MKESNGIEFSAHDGLGNKKILDITKCGGDHLEIQVYDNAETPEESVKFFILSPDRIRILKEWLTNNY
jgi:hypothetical protein